MINQSINKLMDNRDFKEGWNAVQATKSKFFAREIKILEKWTTQLGRTPTSTGVGHPIYAYPN